MTHVFGPIISIVGLWKKISCREPIGSSGKQSLAFHLTVFVHGFHNTCPLYGKVQFLIRKVLHYTLLNYCSLCNIRHIFHVRRLDFFDNFATTGKTQIFILVNRV